jgi:hypothetical protein
MHGTDNIKNIRITSHYSHSICTSYELLPHLGLLHQPFRLLAAFSDIVPSFVSSLTAPFSTFETCAPSTTFMPYLQCLVQHKHSNSLYTHNLNSHNNLVMQMDYHSGTITKSVITQAFVRNNQERET